MSRFLGRFETKLILSFLAAIAVVAGVVGYLAVRPLQEFARNQIARGLEAQARLIALQVAPLLRAPDQLQSPVRRFRQQVGARVTVIDRAGRVLAESDRDPEGMASHADRPEVRQALTGRTGVSLRYSESVGRDLLYVAIPLKPGVEVTGVVRVAVPLAAVEETMGSVQRTVAFTVLGAAAVALLLSFWMARRVTRPVKTMVETAHQMAGGDLSRRIPLPAEQELATLARALNAMAETLQGKIQDLEREQGRTATILESMVEGLVAVDRHRRIVLMNAGARRIFRVEAGEETRSLLEVVRHPDLLSLVDECDRCGEGTVCRRELTWYSPPITLMVHAVPLRRGTEEWGTLMVFHDVTELRQLERIRQEFVANASHELRTPLTAIRGYVETLLDGALEDPERARSFLEVVSRHAVRMGRLIDDLLDLSNIEGGRLALEREATALEEVAEAVFLMHRDAASKKGIRLSLEIPPDLPAVLADRDRLQQILINLVDNAVKFTSAGQVMLAAHKASATHAEVIVADSGAGIPSTDLSRVTERFYRVDRARSRELGGTGLGLSIVKHLVHAHGGELHIESELGRGTRVAFTLPFSA